MPPLQYSEIGVKREAQMFKLRSILTMDVWIIEMNPRVSRSSALASKATGFPIAKVAAKLAVGYTLDELSNDTGGATPISFEPSIELCHHKNTSLHLREILQTKARLSTQMKSVGEVMAMDEPFRVTAKGIRGRDR